MAMAKFVLKTLPGIDRPAIASLMPTRRSEAVFLDLGANAECDADNLVQFAVMGEVFARAVLGRDQADASACSTSAPRRSRATTPSARRPRRCAPATCRSSFAASSKAPT